MRLHLSQVSKAGRSAMFPRDRAGIRTVVEAHGKGTERPRAVGVQDGLTWVAEAEDKIKEEVGRWEWKSHCRGPEQSPGSLALIPNKEQAAWELQ